MGASEGQCGVWLDTREDILLCICLKSLSEPFALSNQGVVTFRQDLTSWIRLLSFYTSSFLGNCSQICPVHKLTNITPTKWRPQFYLFIVKFSRILKQKTVLHASCVLTLAEFLDPVSIQLQWLTDKIQRGNKALLFPTMTTSSEPWTLNTSKKRQPLPLPRCTYFSTCPHLVWDGRDLMKSRNLFWHRQEQRPSAHSNKRYPTSWRHTTHKLAFLESHSPAS